MVFELVSRLAYLTVGNTSVFLIKSANALEEQSLSACLHMRTTGLFSKNFDFYFVREISCEPKIILFILLDLIIVNQYSNI
jgi:hypothetical protein